MTLDSTGLDTRLTRRNQIHRELERGIEHGGVIIIMAPSDVVYNFWRDLSNLPRFMKNLKAIKILNSELSRWTWSALRGKLDVEWMSEIITDIPNALIAWRSLESSTVSHNGEISFQELPYGRGTEVRVTINYHVPGGAVTDFIEKIVGESPKKIIREDLRRLRELIEAGYIPTTEGQSHGGDEEILNPKLHIHH